MIIIRKLISFFRFNHQMKFLIIEAYILLAWARYRKSQDFSKIVPNLGEPMSETTFQGNDHDREVLRRISKAIHIASKYTFWESECLVKAMAGMKMLEKRGIESTLYLGTAKDETGLIAHAWLRSGDFYVSGSKGMETFTVVSTFAKYIKQKKTEGEGYG